MEAITTQLDELPSPLAAPNTDRCPNCNAQMAPDQRYCVNCGERRSGGGLRDALPGTAAAAAATPPGRRHMSANTSFIAGIGCLLLALGVGVLIGRSGDNGGAKSSTPQVVTVQTNGAAGGTAATAGTTAAATKAASTASKHHKSSSKSTKAAKNSELQKTAAKNGVKLPPPVVKVGQKCQKGAKGCEGGKFTGNFFGG